MAFTERKLKWLRMPRRLSPFPRRCWRRRRPGSFEGTLDLAELAAGPDTYTFAAPVSWSVEATNTGDAILIQGTAAGDATTVRPLLGGRDLRLGG